MNQTEGVTLETLNDVAGLLESLQGALDAEAYVAAAECAEGVAAILRGLNKRLVHERVAAGLRA